MPEPPADVLDDRAFWERMAAASDGARYYGFALAWRAQTIAVLEAELVAVLEQPGITRGELRAAIRRLCADAGSWGVHVGAGAATPRVKTAHDASEEAMDGPRKSVGSGL